MKIGTGASSSWGIANNISHKAQDVDEGYAGRPKERKPLCYITNLPIVP